MKKLLIIYYSWSNGNTEWIAKLLQSTAGGELLKIDTAMPYTGSYNDVVEQGHREVNQGYEPELKPVNVDISDYDVIAAGKTVVPFMTNGGWPGHVIKDMKSTCSGAEFACEMQVKFDSNGGDHLETPENKIEAWAQNVKALL